MRRGESMELNFEGLEMQKWDIITDRAQRVGEKKCGHLSSCLVIKMAKTALFCIFYWWQQKNCHSFGEIHKYIWQLGQNCLNGEKSSRLVEILPALKRDLTWVEWIHSHKEQFVFRMWNTLFCWDLTQVRYPAQDGYLTSYNQSLRGKQLTVFARQSHLDSIVYFL